MGNIPEYGRAQDSPDWLRYREIAFGYLYLETSAYDIRFDAEADEIPAFVDIFHHLNNGDCGEWRICDEEDVLIVFRALEQRKNVVLFDVGWAEYPLSFTREYLREDILQMLRDIFQALLTDKDFPYQYPCFDEFDEDICEQEQDKAELLAKGNSALEDDLYKAAFREGRIPLSPKGKELYLRYKKMLEECLNS